MKRVHKDTVAYASPYRRLDTITMREMERWRAKAQLERAEFFLELVARAARAVNEGFQALIVRPLKRARVTDSR